MGNNKEEVRYKLEALLAELQRLRDEIRVRIHLGGMDLRDQWKEFEPRIEEIVQQQKQKATEELCNAAADLRDAFRAFRDKLS